MGRIGALLPLALWLALGCGAAPAQPQGGETAGDRIPRQRSAERYVEMLESPGRATWQLPEQLVAALELESGMQVADLGTGSGYFLPLLTQAVGPEGRVLAEDVDADLIALLRDRIEREGLTTVEARLGEPSDPHLEPGRYDLVLIVNTFHHVSDTRTFLENTRSGLSDRGRVVVVDFDTAKDIPEEVSGLAHRIGRDEVLAAFEAAGFLLEREHSFLPYQLMMEFGSGAAGADTDI